MAAVKSGDTSPEMAVRRLVHGMGYRYRLHVKGLPGKPDMVFRRLRKAIFVHGCFWHMHACQRGRRMPATRREYWAAKLEGNRRRDRVVRRRLRAMGYDVMVVWECQIGKEQGRRGTGEQGKSAGKLAERIRRFLEA